MLPYWYDAIVPDLRAGRTVLVAAHGNSLRALVKHLDGISDDDIAELNLPTGVPFRLRAGRRLPAAQRHGRARRAAGAATPKRPDPPPAAVLATEASAVGLEQVARERTVLIARPSGAMRRRSRSTCTSSALRPGAPSGHPSAAS